MPKLRDKVLVTQPLVALKRCSREAGLRVQAPPLVREVLERLPPGVQLCELTLALGQLDLRLPCLGIPLQAERPRLLPSGVITPDRLVNRAALALDGMNGHLDVVDGWDDTVSLDPSHEVFLVNPDLSSKLEARQLASLDESRNRARMELKHLCHGFLVDEQERPPS